MRIEKAAIEDLKAICGWFKTGADVQLWGGPSLAFPLELEEVKKAIEWSDSNSYSFFNEKNRLIGFAQVFDKFGCQHLSRIVLTPELRGKGISCELLKLLIDSIDSVQDCYSLFVYEHNMSALKLYKRLGFARHKYPDGVENNEGCIFMVRGAITLQ
ncbi:MAG: hypothetical protein CSB48_13345 [Proteobacteria bacterium]|nr:MAG: hypothetical protein CSB48_13345 [Pseudomonadota bacterium]